jgi:hypothetical protein
MKIVGGHNITQTGDKNKAQIGADAKRAWYERPMGIITLGLIIVGLAYWFGWN